VTTPAFTHDRPGTPASAWDRWLSHHAPDGWHLPPRPGRLVVVGAHPDDETLGVGGLIHRAGREGWRIDVVSATAGEGSHPASPTTPPDRLAEVRRGELGEAIGVLAPTAAVTCLGLPDGEVGAHEENVVAALVALVGRDGDDTVICAPLRHDGHPDHEAVGRAAALAARRTDARLVEYPVWLWHWGGEQDLPWERVRVLGLDPASAHTKQRAVRTHRSQVAPLSDQPGDEVLLGEDLLAHFERPAELLVVSDDAFDGTEDVTLDRLHAERADPWDVDSSWYERRKRSVTLACLPAERYARGLEVGCSIGALAADLAPRCDRLLAVDASPAALAGARERLADVPGVETALVRVPEEWPEGRFDLVVVSEVGYFLSPRQLDGLVERCRAAAGGSDVVLCHWRHQPVGWVLDGPAVHERFRTAWLAAGGRVVVEHDDPDFRLTVLTGAS
jgi:LmbE family N-acetylglucosaminyl deacetylase